MTSSTNQPRKDPFHIYSMRPFCLSFNSQQGPSLSSLSREHLPSPLPTFPSSQRENVNCHSIRIKRIGGVFTLYLLVGEDIHYTDFRANILYTLHRRRLTVLLQNGGFCNSCAQNGACSRQCITQRMCHKMTMFHKCFKVIQFL